MLCRVRMVAHRRPHLYETRRAVRRTAGAAFLRQCRFPPQAESNTTDPGVVRLDRHLVDDALDTLGEDHSPALNRFEKVDAFGVTTAAWRGGR